MKDVQSEQVYQELPKKDKDEKSDAEMSEEDKLLQEELEMLVTRLRESDTSLYLPSLEALRTRIRSATTSMTAVPKPLKFLRDHFDTLKTIYSAMQEDTARRFTADVISILAMTMPAEESAAGEALK